METGFITYKNSKIRYGRAGTGRRRLFCLHGYGETLDSFALLSQALSEDFTVTAIDLPFHGSTEWREGPVLDPTDLLAILDCIDPPEGSSRTQVSLLGYSMGGRIALHLYQMAPDRIGRLVLLAPDGLHVNFWYWLATQSSPGNVAFRYTMNNPGWFFGPLKILRKLRLINESIYKFTSQYLRDKKARIELYERWMAMRHFKPAINEIQNLVREKRTLILLIFGRYDRVSPYSWGKRFLKGIEGYGRLNIIDGGHRLLERKNTGAVARLINS
ncbi:MAG TPA: alpha/beta hydrolase [Puia sp.]|nr:alpha/beta hydrolase [Puia sp.]